MSTISNCPLAFRCPKEWERLTPTPEAGVRYCDACTRSVYLCVTEEDLQAHAAAGHCVAFQAPDSEEGFWVGEPLAPKEYDAGMDRLQGPDEDGRG